MKRAIALSYGLCTLLPFSIGVLYFLIGYGHPNPNFPKMSDDMVWFCFSLVGFLVATAFITAISLARFQTKLPGLWGNVLWLSAMCALIAIVFGILFVGTAAHGFLD